MYASYLRGYFNCDISVQDIKSRLCFEFLLSTPMGVDNIDVGYNAEV